MNIGASVVLHSLENGCAKSVVPLSCNPILLLVVRNANPHDFEH